MKTNSLEQLSSLNQSNAARNYWFAIVDAMTTVMDIEDRKEYVRSWKFNTEKNRLTIHFDEKRTEENMVRDINHFARIRKEEIIIIDDENYPKSVVINNRNREYSEKSMQQAESIANLYGYIVPKDDERDCELYMQQLPFSLNAINSALEYDYENEDVQLDNITIGKCVIRHLDKCIVELDDAAMERWNKKGLIGVGMSVRFTYQQKMAQLRCFRATLNRLFGVNNAPLPENSRLPYFMFDTSVARPVVGLGTKKFDGLNDEQNQAVRMALHTEDLSIIQGPAGTGKTKVIAEMVKQLLQENPNCRILIASQTNVAIDNAVKRVIGIANPLRFGRLNKIKEEKVRPYSYTLMDDWAKGKSGETCIAEGCCDMIEGEELLHYRARCRAEYLKRVNVFCSTCCSSGMGTMRRAYNEVYNEGQENEQPWFDIVIIDEASKATMLDMAIPMVMAKRTILIGDHKQLPPYCDKDKSRLLLGLVEKSELSDYMYDKKNDKLRPSQFERMITMAKKKNPSIVTTLRTQYRMHEQIMNLVQRFYEEEGGLECGISDEERQHGLRYGDLLSPEQHAIFLNVEGEEKRDGTSWINEKEEEAIKKIVKVLQIRATVLKQKMPETGIISFYKPKAKKFEDIKGIESATVDKFQGAEKEVIILSTVRSKKLGFIEDRRRLNVALSRAKSLLIVVGKKSLLDENKDYRYIIDNMKVIDYSKIESTLF